MNGGRREKYWNMLRGQQYFWQIAVLYGGNLYFVREVHVERWKHLNHYITIDIYIEILRLFSSLHCLFFYIDPEMGGGGRLGERFKMSAHSPF